MSESKYNDVLPTRIRLLIEEKKITQNTIANEIGVSRQAISQYCDGSSIPNADKLMKIANYFKVSPNYLLGYEETETHEEFINRITDYTGLNRGAIKSLVEDSQERNIELEVINFLLNNRRLIERLTRYFLSAVYDEFVNCEQFSIYPKKHLSSPQKFQLYEILDELPLMRKDFLSKIKNNKAMYNEIYKSLYNEMIDWEFCLECYIADPEQLKIKKRLYKIKTRKTDKDFENLLTVINEIYGAEDDFEDDLDNSES